MSDFEKLTQDNEDFKHKVNLELDSLHQCLMGSTSSPVQIEVASFPDSTSPHPASTQPSTNMSQHGTAVTTIAPVPDSQTQMMLMLTESFTKLSSSLSDKTGDTKSEWPKFSGDAKKFHSWYLAIMAHTSLPPWNEFYDPSKNDIMKTTVNMLLNGKLYSKLLLSLEGAALNIVSQVHL